VDRGPEAPSRLRSAPELDLAPALRRVPHAIHQLAEAIERLPREHRDAVAAELHSRARAAEGGLGKANIRTLSAAGFEIGFHTRRHYLLSTLDDSQLQEAMTEGRQLLEAAADAPMTMIAYPHGKADSRIGAAARAAGYQFGFTASPEAVRPTTDPLLIGRVEALGGSLAQFERALAATLDRVG
jgi:peptidoglycan/xylan/chitin deacetylase (PgdA/CDA1 family)